MKKNIEMEKYYNLPDRVEKVELMSLFEDAMNKYDGGEVAKLDFLEIISELADRQVMSYEILDENIKNRVDRAISDIWNVNNYDEVDDILSIAVNLGLQGCYEKIKESAVLCEDIDKNILKEIRETIKESGDDISNPYIKLEMEFKRK